MPFTPFHLGPGLLLKLALQRNFSLLIFGWSQIVIDIQPLIVLFSGEGHLHGISHTYLGATVLGVMSAISGRYIANFGIRVFAKRLLLCHRLNWRVCTISALIGVYSHVILDSVMHGDLHPYYPFNQHNPMLGLVSIYWLHVFCFICAVVGIVGCALVSVFKQKTR